METTADSPEEAKLRITLLPFVVSPQQNRGHLLKALGKMEARVLVCLDPFPPGIYQTENEDEGVCWAWRGPFCTTLKRTDMHRNSCLKPTPIPLIPRDPPPLFLNDFKPVWSTPR